MEVDCPMATAALAMGISCGSPRSISDDRKAPRSCGGTPGFCDGRSVRPKSTGWARWTTNDRSDSTFAPPISVGSLPGDSMRLPLLSSANLSPYDD